MNVLNQLERKFGRYAIPNLTLYFIAPQILFYALSFAQPGILEAILLIPRRVLQGQIWRLLTFLAVPPVMNPIFAFFFWYLFYLMGSALENYWGTFRYNMYLLIGYAATVAISFLTPDTPSSNVFLQGSVFLAFALLNPDFQLYIFFILPVKIKWLALLTWISYGWIVIFGTWTSRLLVFASVCNYLIFFYDEIRDRMRTGRRHMASQAKHFGQGQEEKAFHRCIVCGITDLTHPNTDFRYCTECATAPCYCPEHLSTHEHVT